MTSGYAVFSASWFDSGFICQPAEAVVNFTHFLREKWTPLAVLEGLWTYFTHFPCESDVHGDFWTNFTHLLMRNVDLHPMSISHFFCVKVDSDPAVGSSRLSSHLVPIFQPGVRLPSVLPHQFSACFGVSWINAIVILPRPHHHHHHHHLPPPTEDRLSPSHKIRQETSDMRHHKPLHKILRYYVTRTGAANAWKTCTVTDVLHMSS